MIVRALGSPLKKQIARTVPKAVGVTRLKSKPGTYSKVSGSTGTPMIRTSSSEEKDNLDPYFLLKQAVMKKLAASTDTVPLTLLKNRIRSKTLPTGRDPVQERLRLEEQQKQQRAAQPVPIESKLEARAEARKKVYYYKGGKRRGYYPCPDNIKIPEGHRW